MSVPFKQRVRLRQVFLAVLGAVCVSLPGTLLEAHGVGYKESDLKPIALDFFYSTGETMSFLETTVYSPKDSEFEYQSARTDEDGRFSFVPNTEGEWRVVVKDNEGHIAEAKINVTDEFLSGGSSSGEGSPALVEEKQAKPEGLDLFVRASLGVSLLFNIAAFVTFTRKKAKAV